MLFVPKIMEIMFTLGNTNVDCLEIAKLTKSLSQLASNK